MDIIRSIGKLISRVLSRLILLFIRFYRSCISPLLLPGKCRFTPTCSEYFMQAVEKYGPFKGSWLGIKRILKCHPFHKGGYDPLK